MYACIVSNKIQVLKFCVEEIVIWLELKEEVNQQVFSFMWNLYLKIYFAISDLVSSRLKFQLDLITTNEAFIGNSVAVV